jgi:transposase
VVAVADEQIGQERELGRWLPGESSVRKLVKQLSQGGQRLHFWYEAGPCGYGLYRQLTALGQACTVVAPTLIPRKSGDRVKTDRRDALALARLGRAGELTGVWVPDEEQESMRDLTRCREDAKAMQRQSRQQLGAFLLRHGRRYEAGKSKWTQAFDRWLSHQKFTSAVGQIVFQEYVESVARATQRVEALDEQIADLVRSWRWWPVIEALMALRGVNLLTAATVLAELGDLRRFDSPPQLMSFLGLVPSESSSGPRVRRGGITRTGNRHVRRVLVESSWSYRFPARMTLHLKKKAQAAPPAAQAIAWKAQKRLCARYRHLIHQGKLQVQACTAVARELCGFIWAIAQKVEGPSSDDGKVPEVRGPGGRRGEPSVRL